MDYHNWQISKIAQVVNLAGEEKCLQPSGGSFQNLKGVIRHLAWAEETWFRRIWNEEPVLLNENMDAATITKTWSEIGLRWDRHLSSLQPSEWSRMVSYTNTQGQAFENSISEIFSHFIDHASYHVGQFMSSARAIGLEPVPCTMIMFFREREKLPG